MEKAKGRKSKSRKRSREMFMETVMETLSFPRSWWFNERYLIPGFIISTLPTGLKISTQVYFCLETEWIFRKTTASILYLSKIVLLYCYLLHIGLPVPGFIPLGVNQQEYCSSLQLGAVVGSMPVSSCSVATEFFYISQADVCMYAVYIRAVYVLCCESCLFMKWVFIWGLFANGCG